MEKTSIHSLPLSECTGESLLSLLAKISECTGKSVICRHLACSKKVSGTSLVAQWLRICLPVQGIQVQFFVQEDPTCCRATKPVYYNCGAPAP